MMGSFLGDLLNSELGHLPLVGDIRGRGLFWAVEFMQDPQNRVPFAPRDFKFCNRVVDTCLDMGLNLLGNLGDTGSVHIEHVIISPPYIVNEEQLRRMVRILRAAIETVTAQFSAAHPESATTVSESQTLSTSRL